MTSKEAFSQQMLDGYSFEKSSIILGGAMYEKQCLPEHFVRIPLKTMNRHGLICGATGTGKTKSLQVIAEQLSSKGVPVLLMDVKGDLSGIAVRGATNAKIEQRHEMIGLPFIPDDSPVELLSLSNEPGVRLRATISEFGPILFSKILDLNETQQSIIAILFKYCDDNHLPLLDLKDLKKVLQYATQEGKEELESEYGRISSSSMGTIMRKLIELEQQDAERFFGERSFEVTDLIRRDSNGKGIISIIRLTDIQDKPKLFSTFMLQMLAEIYASFPEEGDLEKPKLALFIDEAHLIFNEASNALLDQIETIIKLIRSKGIGVFFVTQNPTDIPAPVLSQLGLKIQHALRAFTAKDRKAIKLVAENYPFTENYKVDQVITEMGIGEALVTALNEKGIPTPLVQVMMRAPQSRMDVLTSGEIDQLVARSEIISKYNQEIDRESAYEILNEKIARFEEKEHQEELKSQQQVYRSSRRSKDKSAFEKVFESTTTRQIGRTVARELTRGLLGVLGVKTTR
ncbi:MAG: helicase HerA-like domain-containing protein, partial [Saprospiraceae bacterium]